MIRPARGTAPRPRRCSPCARAPRCRKPRWWRTCPRESPFSNWQPPGRPRQANLARGSRCGAARREGNDVQFATDYLEDLKTSINGLNAQDIGTAVSWLEKQARDEERFIYVCGNGGSAAIASQMVVDLVKGASYRPPEAVQGDRARRPRHPHGLCQRRQLRVRVRGAAAQLRARGGRAARDQRQWEQPECIEGGGLWERYRLDEK